MLRGCTWRWLPALVLAVAAFPAHAGSVVVSVDGIPPGRYAVTP